jgi:HEAT repeat protein
MMAASRPVFVALALALAAAPAFAQGAASPKGGEPTFQDRTLTSWIGDLSGDAPYTRVAAAYAIASMGAAGAPAVPTLTRNLKDNINSVRYSSALALKEIGPPAAEAVPALQEAREDVNDDVAHMARKALKSITGDAVE